MVLLIGYVENKCIACLSLRKNLLDVSTSFCATILLKYMIELVILIFNNSWTFSIFCADSYLLFRLSHINVFRSIWNKCMSSRLFIIPVLIEYFLCMNSRLKKILFFIFVGSTPEQLGNNNKNVFWCLHLRASSCRIFWDCTERNTSINFTIE